MSIAVPGPAPDDASSTSAEMPPPSVVVGPGQAPPGAMPPGAMPPGSTPPEPASTPDRPAPAVPSGPRVTAPQGRRAVLARYRRAVMLGDAAAAVLCAVVAALLEPSTVGDTVPLLASAALPVVWILLIALARGYEARFLGTGAEEYRRVMNAGAVMVAGIAITCLLFRLDPSRRYVFSAVALLVLSTLVGRHLHRDRLFRYRRRGIGVQRVLVVGRADAAAGVIRTFRLEPHHGLVPVGVCLPPVGVSVSHVHGVQVVGDPAQVVEAVDATQADVVAVVSHPDLSGDALRRLSWALEERGVDLVVSPGIVEVAGPRLSIRPVAGLSLLHLERPAVDGGRLLLKSALDRTVSAVLLITLTPVLLIIGAAVRLGGGPGPVLFRQTRVGVNGREFTMLKFRSMVADAEAQVERLQHLDEGNGVLFKLRRDPRITRVGALLRRTSLDELPQLVNVLRGEMSLVGPRPPLPREVAGYSPDAVRRLRVRPGLTGLWQVSGRSDLSWEESLRLDLRYVDNWSIALDMSIMWRTLRAVVRGSGAY